MFSDALSKISSLKSCIAAFRAAQQDWSDGCKLSNDDLCAYHAAVRSRNRPVNEYWVEIAARVVNVHIVLVEAEQRSSCGASGTGDSAVLASVA